MVRHVPYLALCALAAVRAGAPAADSYPVFPAAPVEPAPSPPPPVPGAVPNLTADVLYVVNSKAESVLRVHPAGLVAVTKEVGPVRIRAKFVDGAGKIETRTYPGPCVYLVEAISGKAGRLELDLIPLGLKAESEIQSATVDVNGGQGPQPPPVPPGPQPEPTPAGTVKRFVVVEDTAQAGAWRGDILGSPQVAAHYKAAGLTHRLYAVGGDTATDPAGKAFVERAAGKTLPYLFTFDAQGRELFAGACPTDATGFLKLIGSDPTPRKLGNNERAGGKMRLAWSKFGESPKVPLIPRDKWKPVDLSTFLPPVYDQNGRGQCNASATCTALEACRAQAGLPYVKLSAGDLYSLINDGVDQGSFLEDGLDAAVNQGVATAKTVPYVWDGRKHSTAAVQAERKKFRAVECYLCPDFEAMASALQQGFFIVEGLMWFDGDTPDSAGWLPAVGRGGAGGHALCGYGLEQRNGVWGIRTRNSWSPSWGLNGNCVIPEARFGRQIGGFWAVRSVVQSQARAEPKSGLRPGPFRAPLERELVLKW